MLLKNGRDPGEVRPDIAHQVSPRTELTTLLAFLWKVKQLHATSLDCTLVSASLRVYWCSWTVPWTELACCRFISTHRRTCWLKWTPRLGFPEPLTAFVASWVRSLGFESSEWTWQRWRKEEEGMWSIPEQGVFITFHVQGLSLHGFLAEWERVNPSVHN